MATVAVTDMLIVIPSRLQVGQTFAIKVKLRGAVRDIPVEATWATSKPGLGSPFNLNVQRGIQYKDDCPAQWTGKLRVEAPGLAGPGELTFDGERQGAFAGDTRPIGVFEGFRFEQPGVHFVKLIDEASGLEAWSNAAHATAEAPTRRLWWGDPHFHTIFSDAIRCPEELYAFARDEAFLDFAAMTDHMEALTDTMWSYFQMVTDAYNAPGRFATMQGQEWTNHRKECGAPGHRNIYFPGASGRALRCTDEDCDTLEKLWARLGEMAELRPITIPHHCSNHIMGIDWEQGWNGRFDRAVEVYSVWGNSERPAAAGNPRPIRAGGGEVQGRHWIDAIKAGFRAGFVGGGDVHDGRPGDELHTQQTAVAGYADHLWPQGFTAAWAPTLARQGVFDAIAHRRTYATTRRRIYLDVSGDEEAAPSRIRLIAASEDGVDHVAVVRNGEDVEQVVPADDARIVQGDLAMEKLGPDEFCYLRVQTVAGHLAWSQPWYGDGR